MLLFKTIKPKNMNKTLLLFLLIPVLANAQESLADRMCSVGYIHWSSDTPVLGFENSILTHLGLPANHPEKEKHISKFFNENNAKLICGNDNDEIGRETEHILKRCIALGEHNFLVHVANSMKYNGLFDWNFYEMVDGKKETILDYIDKILADEEWAFEYDVDELKELVVVLEQADAKRGSELKD